MVEQLTIDWVGGDLQRAWTEAIATARDLEAAGKILQKITLADQSALFVSGEETYSFNFIATYGV